MQGINVFRKGWERFRTSFLSVYVFNVLVISEKKKIK